MSNQISAAQLLVVLKEWRRKLLAVLNGASSLAVVIINQETDVVFASEGAGKYLNVGSDTLIGKKLRDIIEQPDRGSWVYYINRKNHVIEQFKFKGCAKELFVEIFPVTFDAANSIKEIALYITEKAEASGSHDEIIANLEQKVKKLESIKAMYESKGIANQSSANDASLNTLRQQHAALSREFNKVLDEKKALEQQSKGSGTSDVELRELRQQVTVLNNKIKELANNRMQTTVRTFNLIKADKDAISKPEVKSTLQEMSKEIKSVRIILSQALENVMANAGTPAASKAGAVPEPSSPKQMEESVNMWETMLDSLKMDFEPDTDGLSKEMGLEQLREGPDRSADVVKPSKPAAPTIQPARQQPPKPQQQEDDEDVTFI